MKRKNAAGQSYVCSPRAEAPGYEVEALSGLRQNVLNPHRPVIITIGVVA